MCLTRIVWLKISAANGDEFGCLDVHELAASGEIQNGAFRGKLGKLGNPNIGPGLLLDGI
jgi:hypothetical protein